MYRFLQLIGSPSEIGYYLASVLQRVASPFRSSAWEHDLAFLAECAAIIRHTHSALWDELAAFADAFDAPAERSLFLRAAALPQACSAVAWQHSSGQIFVGRNYDFYINMPTRDLLSTSSSYGYQHIGMNGGLVGGRYDGINQHGLFVGLHKVMADRQEHLQPGVPFHLLPRLALDLCTSTAEVISLFRELPQLSSFNYTVADRHGHFARLECYPGQPIGVLEADGLLATTNHFDHPDLARLQGRRQRDDSKAREAFLCAAISHEQGDPWLQTAQAMSDHQVPVCCHKEFSSTLWSGLYELTQQRVAYSFGAPCQVGYRELEF